LNSDKALNENSVMQSIDQIVGGNSGTYWDSIKQYVHPVTVDDEAQIAGYELLLSYLAGIALAWQKFCSSSELAEVAANNYSANLSRASVLLPIIAGSNASFMAAMDSVGFTQSERRSSSAKFSTLSRDDLAFNNSIKYSLADITVNDLNDWIDRFANVESPSLLATSGRYGLESVVDQADTLFWVIGLPFYTLFAATNNSGTSNGSSSLLQEILSYERVKQSLRELLAHLKDLADLACPPSDKGGADRVRDEGG
jgi:hypothetical protein